MANYIAPTQIETMNKHEFRKHIAYSLAIQTCFATTIFLILKYLHFDLENLSTLTFFASVGLCSIASFIYIFDPKKYRKRLNDIYPDSKFGIHWYIAAILFPVFLFGLTIFLCIKDPVPHVRTTFGFRTFVLGIVPVICLQLINPNAAYYLASPSVYYLFETTHSAARMIAYQKQLKNSDKVVENYLIRYGRPEKSTEKILLLAVAASEIIKDKNKISKGAENISNSMKYGERLICTITDLYYLSYDEFRVLSYSPMQWLHPGGSFEILLLEGIEKGIMSKFHKTITEKNLDMITKIEKNVGRLPAAEREMYKEKFKKHRQAIEQSEGYKNAIRQRLEDSFPVK